MKECKRLVFFGDSWTIGEISYGKDWEKVEKPFAKILGEQFDLPILNFSRPASSNYTILTQFIHYISHEYREGDFVFVGWTNWRRVCLLACNVRSSLEKTNSKVLYMPALKTNHRFTGESTGTMGWYHRQLNIKDDSLTLTDPLYQTIQSISAYETVKNICSEKNIKFIQTNSFCNDGFKENPHYRKIYNEDDPNWIEPKSEYNTLLDIVTQRWLKSGKKPLTTKKYCRLIQKQVISNNKIYPYLNTCMHPTPEGHKLIAETLAPYIKIKLEE